MEAKELTRTGIKIKVACCDEHLLLDMRGPVLDIRGKFGERLVFMVAFTPGCWPRLKKSIATAERVMIKAGWLEGPKPLTGLEGGSSLEVVKPG